MLQSKLIRIQTPARMPADNELKTAMNTVSGEATTASRSDDISINFHYGPVSYDTIQTVSGGGTIDQFKSLARLNLDGLAGSAALVSKESVRYRAGHETLAAFSHLFAAGEVGVNQYTGLLNDVDGFAVGYQGEEFGVWYIEGGNVNFIPRSAFNVNQATGADLPAFELNPQKLNIYKVSYAWHGGLPAYFSVYGGWERGWILLHVIDESNTAVETHLENPSLPMTAKIERVSGTGAVAAMLCGSWRAGVLVGGEESNLSNRTFHYSAIEATPAASQDTSILLMRNKTTYKSKANHVRARLFTVTLALAGANDVLIHLVTNPTLAATPTWTDTDADNSAMEFSASTIQVTSAIPASAPAFLLSRDDKETADVRHYNISIFPGETLAVVVTAGNGPGPTVSVSVGIEELF